MNAPSAKMLVSLGKQCVCMKVSGRANFASSIDFKTLFNELLRKGYTCFVIDLSECTLMDSTFLGVLAGLGLNLNQSCDGEGPCSLELFNTPACITELLDNLGVLHLFNLVQGDVAIKEPIESTEHTPSKHHTREDMTLNSLEAHRILMDVNPENIARFKDVAAFLAEDLKKLKSRN